jgi:transposase
MTQPIYQSDLTEAQFSPIKSSLQVKRQSKWPLLSIFNAVLYVCNEGVKWRALPKGHYPPWQTVYWYYAKWRDAGAWQGANEVAVLRVRQQAGARPLPAAAVIDSQTTKNTATATRSIGVDGGKKIKGRKRLILTDGAGNLLAVKVFAASRHDGAAAASWWKQGCGQAALLQAVDTIWADQHFRGRFKKTVESIGKAKVHVSREHVQKAYAATMSVHKHRWVVERTFAWGDNSRRLSKDYERLPASSEAFLYISSISRLLRHPKPTG